MQSYTPVGGRHQIINVEKYNLIRSKIQPYTRITSAFAMLKFSRYLQLSVSVKFCPTLLLAIIYA